MANWDISLAVTTIPCPPERRAVVTIAYALLCGFDREAAGRIASRQALCQHENTVLEGTFSAAGGEVGDDVGERCTDCGAWL